MNVKFGQSLPHETKSIWPIHYDASFRAQMFSEHLAATEPQRPIHT